MKVLLNYPVIHSDNTRRYKQTLQNSLHNIDQKKWWKSKIWQKSGICCFTERIGLKNAEQVEQQQDEILGAYKRYMAEKRPTQPVHWAKILMKVTDLRTISTKHAERVLCMKLDNSSDIPPLFLKMFEDGCPWYACMHNSAQYYNVMIIILCN